MDRGPVDDQPTMLQRIAERRALLEAKLASQRKESEGTARNEDGEVQARGRGEEQVRLSRRELASLRIEAEDAVSSYRVKTDAEENERRIREEAQALQREAKTRDEAGSSETRKGSIQLKFESLYEFQIPQELVKEMEAQKAACSKVIEVKDQLIDEFRSQMKDKEEEYVRALKQQTEDIDGLIVEMHRRTDVMVEAYGNQLLYIDKAYNDERRDTLTQCDSEIKTLVNQRTTREHEFKKKREQKVAEAQRILEEKYEEAAEKYNKCKMESQHDIHGLAQELEKCKADFLLNAERLNYNLQVLRERVKENKNAQNQHKRKLTRLQDVLSSLISRYAETDKRFRQANNELTESYRRVTEQYKDLQLKFQHFEKADVDKYNQVWQMHENDCMGLVHKCLQGDRVVFEELLGVPWVPPTLDFWVAQEDQQQDQVDVDETEETDAQIEIGDNAYAMLQILQTQVPFLIEDKAQSVMDDLQQQEGGEVQVQAILQSLGIQQTEQVNELLEYFTVEAEDGTAALINPQEAVRALHAFLDDRRKKQTVSLPLEVSKADNKASVLSEEAAKEKARRAADREFWERMGKVVPPSHKRIWKALESGLEQHLAQLQRRFSLIEETDSIRKQNDELRALLNQYLGSRINEELFAPPQLQVVGSSTR
jgi:dynein regulatry complex protein 1